MILHSYNRGEGVKNLQKALEVRGEHTLILDRMPKRPHPMIVCWGSEPLGYHPNPGSRILNPPSIARVFSNKLRFFKSMWGHNEFSIEGDVWPCPEFTTDPEVAKSWPLIVVRHSLTGSGGEGIEIIKKGQDLPKAPLYTRYQKKSSEFRVHMFRIKGGYESRFIQKKTAKNGVDADFRIRNAENGFVFQQNGFETPKAVLNVSQQVLGYFPPIDFVALDIIYSKKEDRAWVLEGNTAPGLQGKTISVYADYLIERKKQY